MNFYRWFIKNAAKVVAPLTDGLKGPASAFLWTPAMQSSFTSAKALLVKVVRLSHPIPKAALSVVTYAFATHVGAALQQWSSLGAGGAWQPLAFFFKEAF